MPNTTSEQARATAVEALHTLMAGNARFAEGVPEPHVVSPAQREALLGGQDPYAVVLGCVDARVPPEVVFDQGVGDLFTVRTAGHSLAGVALGSIEFGVRRLGVPLVIVMAHSGCGAVLAALAKDPADGHLGELTGEVASRLASVVGDDPVGATGANLEATVEVLRSLGTLTTPAGHDAFVVGVLYDMATGVVQVTDDAGLLQGAS
ncbi:carbonic anhydrase [Aquihabitans sp. McL0605]|uniref:carbonic anhydrase n=1 Tax=Aquihabitans sp. McL0605 TaxID=3415671 RepID=UPI003CF33541